MKELKKCASGHIILNKGTFLSWATLIRIGHFTVAVSPSAISPSFLFSVLEMFEMFSTGAHYYQFFKYFSTTDYISTVSNQ